MGSADQERLSHKLRGEVRRLAGIDFTKTWTNFERGETGDGQEYYNPPPAHSISSNIDRKPVGVMEGMSAHGWGRSATTTTIKSIICRGRVNAARKRNKELAAAGTPVPRGHSATHGQAPVPAPLERPPVQALLEADIRRLFNRGMTKRRRVALALGEREPSELADVIIKISCQSRLSNHLQGPDLEPVAYLDLGVALARPPAPIPTPLLMSLTLFSSRKRQESGGLAEEALAQRNAREEAGALRRKAMSGPGRVHLDL